MDEPGLVKDLQHGSEIAFKRLVDEYQNMIFSTSYGFLHNTEEAEDVTQEVFIQVFKSINKFKGESKLSTWIYRIAVNRSLNKIRSRKSQFIVAIDELFDGSSTQPFSNSATPLEEVENIERAQVLHQAIDKLPVNQRTAFILSKFDGFGNVKIAEIMETTLSAVEGLINRAKKNLQKELVEYYRMS